MQSLQGHLLLASPKLVDPNFFRTVVLMVQHSDEGALGLVLNRPTETTIREAWAKVSDKPCHRDETLYHGGPCESSLMVIHAHEPASQIEVVKGLHFCTEAEYVEVLIEKRDGPIRFFVGFAGWMPGQLEKEMETASWRTTPATVQHIFDADQEQWATVTRQIAHAEAFPDVNPKVVPKDPSMN